MLKNWWWPSLSMIALATMTVVLLNSYFALVNRNISDRSVAVTREIANNLRADIEAHVRVLETLGEMRLGDDFEGPSAAYNSAADAILANYPSFYAINWVDAKGVIARVRPYEKNKAALGRNIITERHNEAVFENSRVNHAPVLGRKVKMFQGIEAVAVSVPIFEKNVLQGWVNGVLDLDTFLRNANDSRRENLSLKLVWKDDPSSEFNLDGDRVSHVTRNEFRLLGTDLVLEVGIKDVGDSRPALPQAWVAGAALLMVALIGALLFGLQGSQRRLVLLNQRLRLKNALVSSLAHDMGTPLTVLNMAIERAKEKPDDAGVWDRLAKSALNLLRMLDSVKLIHAMETGHLEIKVEAVSLTEAVTAALDQVSVLAANKKITVVNEAADSLPLVFAEASTLAQNVIPNLLTNAIKFSPAGSVVRLSSSVTDHTVSLILADSGFGIPPEKLDVLLGRDGAGSDEGTAGEKGSGLGMIQVRTFMDVYKGSLGIVSKIGTADRGTVVTLTFRRAAHAGA